METIDENQFIMNECEIRIECEKLSIDDIDKIHSLIKSIDNLYNDYKLIENENHKKLKSKINSVSFTNEKLEFIISTDFIWLYIFKLIINNLDVVIDFDIEKSKKSDISFDFIVNNYIVFEFDIKIDNDTIKKILKMFGKKKGKVLKIKTQINIFNKNKRMHIKLF
jgi:hypothetical protein